jgi:ankyrin repeat protein
LKSIPPPRYQSHAKAGTEPLLAIPRILDIYAVPVMYLLLKHGAKVHERGGVGRTALHQAANNAKVTNVKVLLSLGADIDARDKENNTPLLFLAVRVANVPNEDLETITWMLLDRNADVNAKNVVLRLIQRDG